MRITRLNQRGFALEATMILLVLLATLIGAAVAGIVMVQKTAGIDYRGSRTTYASEAGADHVMSQLELAMSDGSISDADLAGLTAPSIPGMTITASGVRNGIAAPRTITAGPYTGLIGLNQRIDVTVQARDQTANRSQVVVSVNAQTIPLFQFGVFYEGDLEIHNGPPLNFAGWVHTNGNLYLSSDNQTFKSMVTTAGNVYHQRKAYNERLNGVAIFKADTVTSTLLDFDSRSDPTPSAFSAKSASHFDSRLQTAAMGVTALRLPLPTGMPAIAMVQPRSGGDTPEVQSVKMAWKADYHLTIDLNSPVENVCTGSGVVLTRPNSRQVPTGAACAAIFVGKTNAFLEGRENKGVDLLTIDVGALNAWIATDSTHNHIEIMYITFINDNAGNPARDYPAVRLKNGNQLMEPFTVATDAPMYIWGNYNNALVWHPSALMGDAITFLSNDWLDAPHAAFAYTATVNPMYVNAAIAAGHSATPCDWQVGGCSSPPYGGGLENFPRFLEDWGGSSSGRTMHYRGSLVSLFESAKANLHLWSWRGYYNAPQRDWQFDLRFQDPSNLPPGTPNAGSVAQIAFRPVY
ncbi:MAG: hypothetical protein ABJC74_14835 [Gemmatimonadota bacterium]